MDPNETLRRLRNNIRAYHDATSEYDRQTALGEVLECAEAMDQWLSRGGFLPDDWQAPVHGSLADDELAEARARLAVLNARVAVLKARVAAGETVGGEGDDEERNA